MVNSRSQLPSRRICQRARPRRCSAGDRTARARKIRRTAAKSARSAAKMFASRIATGRPACVPAPRSVSSRVRAAHGALTRPRFDAPASVTRSRCQQTAAGRIDETLRRAGSPRVSRVWSSRSAGGTSRFERGCDGGFDQLGRERRQFDHGDVRRLAKYVHPTAGRLHYARVSVQRWDHAI